MDLQDFLGLPSNLELTDSLQQGDLLLGVPLASHWKLAWTPYFSGVPHMSFLPGGMGLETQGSCRGLVAANIRLAMQQIWSTS